MEQEIKRKNFERIATKRVNKILKDIDSLKNLKNPSFYDYSREDLKKILKALIDAVEGLQDSYFKGKYKRSFKL